MAQVSAMIARGRSSPYSAGGGGDGMKLDQFDYIDFGGLSTREDNIALSRFKGEKGLVVTDDADVAAAARAMGSAVSAGDAATIKGFEGKVRFALIGNLLERCASFEEVRLAINAAVNVSRSFVYIQTPWFDSDGELLRAGLKLHWSDWTTHTMPLTSLQLLRAVQPMLRKEAIARLAIFREGVITSADDPRILPCGIGRDSGRYKAEVHGEKPGGALARPVYSHLVGLIARRDPAMVEGALAKMPGLESIFDSAADVSPAAPTVEATAKGAVKPALKVTAAPTPKPAARQVRTRMAAPRVRG